VVPPQKNIKSIEPAPEILHSFFCVSTLPGIAEDRLLGGKCTTVASSNPMNEDHQHGMYLLASLFFFGAGRSILAIADRRPQMFRLEYVRFVVDDSVGVRPCRMPVYPYNIIFVSQVFVLPKTIAAHVHRSVGAGE